MSTKTTFLFSVMIILATLNSTSVAETKVVVIPLMGDEAPTPDPKIVFISPRQDDHDLGGLVGADSICANTAATNPQLEGKTFKAWLVDVNTATFEGENFDPSIRTFNLPQGELTSPVGEVFPERWVHFLKYDGPFNEMEPDCNNLSYSDCMAVFANEFPIPDVTGASIYDPLASFNYVHIIHTLSSYDTGSLSSNCKSFTSSTFEYGTNESRAFWINLLANRDGTTGIDMRSRAISCNTERSYFWCLEQ